MKLSLIEQDIVSGLSLLRDANDPPRFYVQWKQRRELIAIGDESLARRRFAVWRARGMENLVAAEAARRLKVQRRAAHFLKQPETQEAGIF